MADDKQTSMRDYINEYKAIPLTNLQVFEALKNEPNDVAKLTCDYLSKFVTPTTSSIDEAVKQIIQNGKDLGLEEYQIVQLINLMPEDSSEAHDLLMLPNNFDYTVADKIIKDIKQMLNFS
eukprot:TRINITY_DN918_c1_g2_i1.p1 TRINITY_DN918_c1_g2~~TRINITY_DN918_c1_g2_i1.p1  ORF type:complete len:121 (-),score=58.34 TRINITY_DN918_c1_g2_i1:140-502(-)